MRGDGYLGDGYRLAFEDLDMDAELAVLSRALCGPEEMPDAFPWQRVEVFSTLGLWPPPIPETGRCGCMITVVT